MKPASKLLILTLSCLALSAVSRLEAQSIITEWTFDNYPADTGTTYTTSPTPTTGSGTAQSIGMVNNYTVNSTEPNTTDASDIYNLQGSDGYDDSATNNFWRIVGTNGWSSQAPIGTQGAQFDVSTAGYTGISISFDVYVTTQGEANLQLEYSTNGGSTWTNAALTYSGSGATIATNSSNPNIVNGSYLAVTTNSNFAGAVFNDVTANLSGVSAASNNSNFEFEIVNAATGTADVSGKGSALNNTSGNWRFDDVEVTGVASVPEPSTWAMMAGAFALLFVAHRRRSSAK